MYKFEKRKEYLCADLPLAIILNRKFIPVKGGRPVLSKEYRNYKKQIDDLYMAFKHIKPIKKKYIKKQVVKNLVVEIILFEKDNRRDIDATIKILFDCLNGKLFEDDAQIWKLFVTQYVDPNPRVEITVLEEARN